MEHDGSTFLCGYAAFFDVMFFAKSADEYAEDDIENASFFLFGQPDWMKYEFDASWYAVAMATIKKGDAERVAVAISSDGDYWEVKPASIEEQDGKIEQAAFPLSNLGVIDHSIFACGMGRTVLQRKSPGKWTEIGPGPYGAGAVAPGAVAPGADSSDAASEDEDPIVGFEDIDGFSKKDMYAAGWGGEIWHRDGKKWQQLDSPTSEHLNAVCCAEDGKVYVVGDNGTLVVGRGDEWELIESDFTGTFQDVACYRGVIYICTDFEILKLDDGELIAEQDFEDADDLPNTCLHLLAGEDAIFSMGTKDLYRNTDGVWERFV